MEGLTDVRSEGAFRRQASVEGEEKVATVSIESAQDERTGSSGAEADLTASWECLIGCQPELYQRRRKIGRRQPDCRAGDELA